MATTGTLEVIATKVFDSPGRILVVGDGDGKQGVAETLERGLHKVIRSERGAEVVTLAKEQQVDMIICSLTLTDLDGFEVCRRIKAHPELQFVPFLLMGGAKDLDAQ